MLCSATVLKLSVKKASSAPHCIVTITVRLLRGVIYNNNNKVLGGPRNLQKWCRNGLKSVQPRSVLHQGSYGASCYHEVAGVWCQTCSSALQMKSCCPLMWSCPPSGEAKAGFTSEEPSTRSTKDRQCGSPPKY